MRPGSAAASGRLHPTLVQHLSQSIPVYPQQPRRLQLVPMRQQHRSFQKRPLELSQKLVVKPLLGGAGRLRDMSPLS